MGARVRRSIGRPELRTLDPFLMLDEFRVALPAGFQTIRIEGSKRYLIFILIVKEYLHMKISKVIKVILVLVIYNG